MVVLGVQTTQAEEEAEDGQGEEKHGGRDAPQSRGQVSLEEPQVVLQPGVGVVLVVLVVLVSLGGGHSGGGWGPWGRHGSWSVGHLQ